MKRRLLSESISGPPLQNFGVYKIRCGYENRKKKCITEVKVAKNINRERCKERIQKFAAILIN